MEKNALGRAKVRHLSNRGDDAAETAGRVETLGEMHHASLPERGCIKACPFY